MVSSCGGNQNLHLAVLNVRLTGRQLLGQPINSRQVGKERVAILRHSKSRSRAGCA